MKILLIAYDNDSFISVFPLGLAYIASACREAGHEVKIYNQDVNHWPEEHLLELLNKKKFDVVGMGIVAGYYQYRKLLKISQAINASKNRPFFVIGGHGPSPEPAYFLRKTKADAVIIGEGELTVVELLKTLESKKSLSTVKGIAFIDNNKFIQTPRRPLIPDINKIAFPAWDLFPIDHYSLLKGSSAESKARSMMILSARGCTFKCNFCYRMDDGQRLRSPESIVDEIKRLQKDYSIVNIGFEDELLMSSAKRTVELCESFIKAKLKFNWRCSGRLNYANPEVLKLMKDTGCFFINYGIESLDDKVLKNMNKGLTQAVIIKGIENTLKAGISPGLNIIFGNIGDNAETLNKSVEFLLKYDDGSQLRTIRPVTPYPGSPLYYYAIEKGLLKDCADFYENKHLNSDLLTVNFTDFSDDEFYKCLMEANIRLIKNYYKNKLDYTLLQCDDLYIKRNAGFRGFRQT